LLSSAAAPNDNDAADAYWWLSRIADDNNYCHQQSSTATPSSIIIADDHYTYPPGIYKFISSVRHLYFTSALYTGRSSTWGDIHSNIDYMWHMCQSRISYASFFSIYWVITNLTSLSNNIIAYSSAYDMHL
jgi:hypothetical protein